MGHRSKQFRRQVEQQRRQELERQKMIEAAKEESQAIIAKAIAEVKTVHDQAEAKMREVQTVAYEMQARVTQRAHLEEEARLRLAAVEVEASEIRARAEEEARLIREQ